MSIKHRVLVIDDDLILLKRVQGFLEATNNYVVETASSGGVGIQKVFEFSPELVICDISMNDLDGYEVYNILKQSKIIYSTIFIFLTGSESPHERKMGMYLGVDDFLQKPVVHEELLQVVKTRLQKQTMMKGIVGGQFEQVVDITPNPVFLITNEGDIKITNEAFMLKLGYNSEELQNMNVSEIFSPESLHSFLLWIKLAKKGVKQNFQAVVSMKTKNKSEVKVHLNALHFQFPFAFDADIFCLMYSDNNVLEMIKDKMTHPQSFIDPEPEEDTPRINVKEIVANGLQINENVLPVKLSKREKEVLELSCRGFTIKEIAGKLFISDRTVEKHRAQLMARFSARNFIEVFLYVIKNKIIKL
ncbi:MAG: response regulator [Hyphomicrobiales bacterium]